MPDYPEGVDPDQDLPYPILPLTGPSTALDPGSRYFRLGVRRQRLGAGGAPRAGTLAEFMALIAEGQQAIVAGVRAAIPRGIDPAAGQIGGLGALGIRDRLDALGLEEQARRANEAVWAGHVNARLDQAGLSSALRWAAAGGHWQLMHEASATYRVAGGMSGFTAAIAADVAAQIRLGATVTRVAHAAARW